MERASYRRAKGVQMRREGQLKDHTVFPSGNTVSSKPASRPALLCSASGDMWDLVVNGPVDLTSHSQVEVSLAWKQFRELVKTARAICWSVNS